MSIHSGHRQRMKEEYLSRGLDGMPEHRTLELLLFYAIPQGDVNGLAHELIERFGSLAGVLDAPVEELMKVPGVGQHTAVLLSLIPAVGGKYLESRLRMEPDDCMRSSREIRKALQPYYFGAREEMVYLMGLDAKLKLLGIRKVSEGTANTTQITARKVMEHALSLGASAVVLAHNHPSGLALPSAEDKLATARLKKLLADVDIELRDHVIFVDDDMVSLRDSGMLELL